MFGFLLAISYVCLTLMLLLLAGAVVWVLVALVTLVDLIPVPSAPRFISDRIDFEALLDRIDEHLDLGAWGEAIGAGGFAFGPVIVFLFSCLFWGLLRPEVFTPEEYADYSSYWFHGVILIEVAVILLCRFLLWLRRSST